jgi:exo-beta-1,3-glucanase (GH17 family)
MMFFQKWFAILVLVIPSTAVQPTPLPPPPQLSTLCWVAYAPSHFNPEIGDYPTTEEITDDLNVLRAAGFNGLVTYGIENTLADVPDLAEAAGFSGILIGVWLPEDDQITRGINARNDITLGYVVGNENLKADSAPIADPGYYRTDLEEAIERIHTETGLPVATSEPQGKYFDPAFSFLLDLGDWIFPNVHPYYALITDPGDAIEWTEEIYNSFREERPSRVVTFKEVGLPTRGAANVSESNQLEYYRGLWYTHVDYMYFEAFDQYWKDHTPVEPYWGLFRRDRTPKRASGEICGSQPARNYIQGNTAVLSWSPVTWAAQYEVWIDRSTSFGEPLIDQSVVSGSVFSMTTSTLTDGLYYWRVRALRADGTPGSWSSPDHFVVDAL